MRNRKLLLVVLLTGFSLAIVCWPTTASAEVVFDTFGPGDSYNENFKYSSGGMFHFDPSKSGLLASITVALGRTSTATTQTQFALSEEISPSVFFPLVYSSRFLGIAL